jgi:hypothetical protein
VDLDWADLLSEQLDWQWQEQLRPRFEGLSDEEYFWEPVAGCWSIRPAGQGRAATAAPSGSTSSVRSRARRR